MVALAIFLGIYAYLILALGLLGWLYRFPVFLVTILSLVFFFFYIRKDTQFNPLNLLIEIKKDRLALLAISILVMQMLVNLIGAVSPELSFDALWYHLTSAKLYVQNHQIFYIPGGLLWPANVPRLIDMYFVTGLLFADETLAKLFHFSFGVLSAMVLFNLLKRYFSLRLSLLGVVTFYTMLIIGWQSTTAYVELGRTFFEILALDFFLRWIESKKQSFLLEAGVLVGLAISSKIIAFESLLIFLILILVFGKQNKFLNMFKFTMMAILVAAPWFVLSFIHTGNPLFPLFGNLRDPSLGLIVDRHDFPPVINLILAPLTLWRATFSGDNFISPIYIIFFPLVLISIWKQKMEIKVAALYCLLSLGLTYTFSNRYLSPYLPGFTLVAFCVFNYTWSHKRLLEKSLITIILFSAILNVGSRMLATKKFLPYVLGLESKDRFLSSNLNYQAGDFYDIDGYFAENIRKDDLVLVYGIHNLYYANFPYDHESWARPGTFYTHILVGNNQKLPEKYGKRWLLYENPVSRVKLYVFGNKYQ